MELPLTRFLPKGSSENGVSARKKEECSRPIPFNAAGDTQSWAARSFSQTRL